MLNRKTFNRLTYLVISFRKFSMYDVRYRILTSSSDTTPPFIEANCTKQVIAW